MATAISIAAGDGQAGKVVGSAADTLIARVTDTAGDPVSGAVVEWRLTSGTGAIASPRTTTSAEGLTGNLLTLGATPGPRVVRASLAGGMAEVLFTVTAVAGPAVTVGAVSHAVVLDSGATNPALWTAEDAFGNPASLGGVTFLSRNPAGTTVSAAGAVTGRQRGNTIVVASLPGAATDSIVVLVASPGGPTLVTSVANFVLAASATIDVVVILDMRSSGETLGATTVQLAWNPALLTYQGDADAGNGLGATVNATGAATGTLLFAAANAGGLPGRVAIRTVTFRAAPATGVTGALTLSTTEVRAALTFRDLLARTGAGSYPLVTR